MDNAEQYRSLLIRSVSYAEEKGTFSKKNIAKSADIVYAYGTGKYFEDSIDQWKYKDLFNVTKCVDRDSEKWGGVFHGLPCVSPEDMEADAKRRNIVVIPFLGKFQEFCRYLQNRNIAYMLPSDCTFEELCDMPTDIEWFKTNGLLETFDMLSDDESKAVYVDIVCNRIAQPYIQRSFEEIKTDGEYFGVVPLTDKEVYVDCGAFDGDTIEMFLKSVGGKYNHIYGFEMADGNYCDLNNNVNNMIKEYNLSNDSITLFRAGVWNENTVITYGKESAGTGESYGIFKTDHMEECPSVKIDDTLSMPPSLIKMDIEGAELNALKGAERSIKNSKPKLAICLYHRLQDFWEIPIYLKGIVPEYKFYVRHHQPDLGGTVLYAIA